MQPPPIELQPPPYSAHVEHPPPQFKGPRGYQPLSREDYHDHLPAPPRATYAPPPPQGYMPAPPSFATQQQNTVSCIKAHCFTFFNLMPLCMHCSCICRYKQQLFEQRVYVAIRSYLSAISGHDQQRSSSTIFTPCHKPS